MAAINKGKNGGVGHVHPFIAAALKGYYATFGHKVGLKKILSAANKTMKDMPSIKEVAAQGKTLCYSNTMGECPLGSECKFHHVPGQHIPDNFATEVCHIIRPGVEYVIRNGNTPGGGGGKYKKIKTEK